MKAARSRSIVSRGLCGISAVALAASMGACSGPRVSPSHSASASALATAASTVPSASPGGPSSASQQSFLTPGATPGETWSAITWTKLPADSPLLAIRAVVHWSGGYVAYGGRGLWASTDGRSWAPSKSGLPADRMIVAETASGLVALAVVGAECPTADAPCYPSAAGPVTAWTSTDGLTWTEQGPAVGITGLQLMAVAGGPEGAVVATLYGNRSGVSFSADGVTWRSVSVPSVSSEFWCSVAGFGSGRYVLLCPASKETASGDLPTQPVWSTDSVHWVAGKAPSTTDRPAGMDRILAGRDGFMVTGYIPGEAGPEQWWRSTDATSWQIVAGYSPVGIYVSHAIPGGTYAHGGLCGDGARLVAFAFDSDNASLTGQAWASWDGKSWAKLTTHGTPQAGQLAEILFPAGVLAGGWWGAAG